MKHITCNVLGTWIVTSSQLETLCKKGTEIVARELYLHESFSTPGMRIRGMPSSLRVSWECEMCVLAARQPPLPATPPRRARRPGIPYLHRPLFTLLLCCSEKRSARGMRTSPHTPWNLIKPRIFITTLYRSTTLRSVLFHFFLGESAYPVCHWLVHFTNYKIRLLSAKFVIHSNKNTCN